MSHLSFRLQRRLAAGGLLHHGVAVLGEVLKVLAVAVAAVAAVAVRLVICFFFFLTWENQSPVISNESN